MPVVKFLAYLDFDQIYLFLDGHYRKEQTMDFSEIIKRGQDEGKEKHFPTITIDKGHKVL
jgi:hypothetical protein